MKESKFEWSSFLLPMVKKVSCKLLSNDLESVTPMSIEDAAKGRVIKPYPIKYDSFVSAEDLKNYIEKILEEDDTLKAEWLSISKSATLPFNFSKKVYYTPVNVVSITCHRPTEDPMEDRIFGKTICELNPEDPIVKEIQNIINQLKD